MMVPELIVTVASFIVGLTSLMMGLTRWLGRHASRAFEAQEQAERALTIDICDGPKLEFPPNLSATHLEGLLEPLRTREVLALKTPPDASSESGFVMVDVLLLVVPGIIALLFAGAFIYLLLANQNVPNYTTPKELTSALTTIIGYYFGVGASAAANKSTTVKKV